MKDFIHTQMASERAILVGLITAHQNEAKTNEYLDELAFLAETAGAQPERRFLQRLDYPNTRTYVGTGKLQEIKEYIEMRAEDEDGGVGLVIFDDELSPKQLQNIKRELQVKILDRTTLILDIFALRAQTANAKTQVELAQYQYLLPRLTRLWTHLERQRGGIGMRGPGETQIETDRRIILDRISRLKEELRSIDRQKVIQRKNRGKMVRVALVGYTNVGKSTLMNLLSKSEVFAENNVDGYELNSKGFIDPPLSSLTPTLVDDGGYSWKYITPTRMMFGASYIFAKRVAVSVDYERDWYNGIRVKNSPYGKHLYDNYFRESFKGSNELRVGVECRVIPQVALRMGYGLWSGALRDSNAILSSPVTHRIDTMSVGAGIALAKWFSIDVAYQFRKEHLTPYMAYYYTDATNDIAANIIDSKIGRHTVLMTLGFRF